MIDTINKWYASKQAGSYFDISSYYDRITTVPTALHGFTPGYSTFCSTSSSVPPSHGKSDNDNDDELSQLIMRKLSLADGSKKHRILQSLVEAGVLEESLVSAMMENDGHKKKKKEM